MTDDRSKARLLYQKAKDAAEDLHLCLSYLQQAYALDPKTKYEEKITKLRQMMEQSDRSDDSESSDDVILISESFLWKKNRMNHSEHCFSRCTKKTGESVCQWRER